MEYGWLFWCMRFCFTFVFLNWEMVEFRFLKNKDRWLVLREEHPKFSLSDGVIHPAYVI